jgi:hypothetical protein
MSVLGCCNRYGEPTYIPYPAVVALATPAPGVVVAGTVSISTSNPYAELSAIDCGSPLSCWAVGYGNGAFGPPGVAAEIVGGQVLFKPGQPAWGIACVPATCYAIWQSSVFDVNTLVGSTVPGIDLRGIDCAPSATCYAAGQVSASGMPVVVPITSGSPGPTTSVPGTAGRDRLDAIGCFAESAETICVAVGLRDTFDAGQPPPLNRRVDGIVVRVANGTPGTPEQVLGAMSLEASACASAATCTAAGIFVGGAAGAVTTVANS